MNFRYIHESPLPGGGKQCSNIMWDTDGKWPSKKEGFPVEHPVNRFATELEEFRALGYWVSPFPEGDGFTMELLSSQSAEQVVADVISCFGWTCVNSFVAKSS